MMIILKFYSVNKLNQEVRSRYALTNKVLLITGVIIFGVVATIIDQTLRIRTSRLVLLDVPSLLKTCYQSIYTTS